MTTRYYTGKAVATKQKQTRTVTGSAIGATFTFTIGSVSVLVTATAADTTLTAALIAYTLRNYDHPYYNAINFTSSGAVVTLESKTAGVPFVYSVVAAVGGTTTAATVTAGTGPNYANDANNWSGNTLPVADDKIVFINNNIDICWGLDLSSIDSIDIEVYASNTGRIGLDARRFATSANARQMDIGIAEYRDLALKVATLNYNINIGMRNSPADVGADRINIDTSANPPDSINIWSTANQSADIGSAVVRIITASAPLIIHDSPGGVSISNDTPTDTASALNSLSMLSNNPASWCVVGETTTVGTILQRGGNIDIRDNNSMTEIKIYDGYLKVNGTEEIANIYQYGGYFIPIRLVTGDDADNYYYYGGTLDLSQRRFAYTPDDFYVGDLLSNGQIIAPVGKFAFGTALHFTGKINIVNRSKK